jgi:hypothetical protein
MTSLRRIAYFITPHGYGHAARSVAIMAALNELEANIQFEIFTRVPAWVFEDSLNFSFGFHRVLTDIGLAQKNSLVEDLPETLERLAQFLPFEPALVNELADQVNRLGCQAIMCDISPLGIAVAKAASLPAVLIENFTWDWIYAGYLSSEPRLAPYISDLQGWFASADYHIQTRPMCLPQSVDLTTAPVSRKYQTPAGETRRRLGLPLEANVILLTMGGILWDFNTFFEQLAGQPDIYFIIPGGSERFTRRRANLVLLPHHSEFYHPDLVNAADAVIGKLGYSTLAEVYHTGLPFGYIPRPGFRESEVLAHYVDQQMSGLAITAAQFESGAWLSQLTELLALPRIERAEPNGADEAAYFIAGLLA